MKRLFNEYSAYEGGSTIIEEILTESFNQIWDIVSENDICPRDAQLTCIETISVLFSQEILRKAMAKRRLERNARQWIIDD